MDVPNGWGAEDRKARKLEEKRKTNNLRKEKGSIGPQKK